MPLGTHKATLFGVAGVSTGGDVVLLHDTDYSDVASASITSGIDVITFTTIDGGTIWYGFAAGLDMG